MLVIDQETKSCDTMCEYELCRERLGEQVVGRRIIVPASSRIHRPASAL